MADFRAHRADTEPRNTAGWQEIGDALDRSPRRDARYRAAHWALDTLQDQLGADWLQRAGRVGDGESPMALNFLGTHAQALAEALEWALRLEMCGAWNGSADFLRDLVNDPRPARILHSRSQLAQASFAERLGWPVTLEPGGDSGSPADLAFESPSGTHVAEIRVLMQSDHGRGQREVAQDTTEWLFWLGLEQNVWIGGELGREPDEDERNEIEEFVRQEAAGEKKGDRPRFSRPGISLEISERGSTAPPLTSPPVREELFSRMVRAIADKAGKMEASGAQWLHVTALTGLWPFTSWGRSPLDSKLPVMSAALAEALMDRCPAGIVLTSAAGLAPEGMTEEAVRGKAGIALRSAVQPLRARESLILPFGQESHGVEDDWLALASAESNWLSWALARRGLPSLAEVFGLAAN